MQRAQLMFANLENANLRLANLTDEKLADAKLINAHLENSNLADTDLAGADLTDAHLTGATLSRAYIYVDAHTGEIVHKNDIIKHAVASGTLATRYSGTRTTNTDSYSGSYRLRDYSRGN